MTSIEKLDSTLDLLLHATERTGHFEISVVDATTNLENLYEAEIVLKKLVKDGYAAKWEVKNPEANRYLTTIDIFSLRHYSVTFEGKLFSESGGYGGREKRETSQATLQFWQTWAIVVGTLMAGLYGVYEIARRIF